MKKAGRLAFGIGLTNKKATPAASNPVSGKRARMWQIITAHAHLKAISLLALPEPGWRTRPAHTS